MDEMIRKIKQHTVSIERNRTVYAVLLPLVYLNDTWQILYEVRSSSISNPGQTAFPGGGVEKGETAQEGAVRETVEELGVSSDAIELIGQLDPLIDQERIIYCFVGRLAIDDLDSLSINRDEVDRVFTLSLSELIENPSKNYQITYQPTVDSSFPFKAIGLSSKDHLKGFTTQIPIYPTSESLWGLTAQFTEQFISLLI